MKKIFIMPVVVLCILFSLIACTTKDDDSLEWTNENAVYASIKAGFENEILQDVEASFSTLSFQKVYIVAKNINVYTPLALLFVLNESGASKQQEFRELLMQDSRVNHASNSRDLPFEPINTCRIEGEKNTITVGETLILEVKGNRDYYYQPFGFNGLFVKLLNFLEEKIYKISDFPQVNLKSIETWGNGWLYLELATEDYFNVVKAIDKLSRLSTIEKVEPDKSEITFIPPAIWEISDYSVAVFLESEGGAVSRAIVKGIKAGKVTVNFAGISYEITVQ